MPRELDEYILEIGIVFTFHLLYKYHMFHFRVSYSVMLHSQFCLFTDAIMLVGAVLSYMRRH